MVGLFVHLGSSLQAAAERDLDELELVVHTLRTTAVDARRCLVTFQGHRRAEFFALGDDIAPEDAVEALDIKWQRLLVALPVT